MQRGLLARNPTVKVCAWCKAWKKISEPEIPGAWKRRIPCPSGQVKTHGICPECRKKAEAEIPKEGP
jgi:hypothetical protein